MVAGVTVQRCLTAAERRPPYTPADKKSILRTSYGIPHPVEQQPGGGGGSSKAAPAKKPAARPAAPKKQTLTSLSE